ncbi:MAG TPA: hypothetical protein ENJ93_02005, partial [Chloroflexi bacterium]|nr:hypothetical protein [Chloroflexota bacterium]
MAVFLFLFLLAAYFFIYVYLIPTEPLTWVPSLIIVAIIYWLAIGTIYFLVDKYSVRLRSLIVQVVGAELQQLRAANKRAESLQSMASVMRATLSFEKVVEEALNVCSLTIEEMGVPAHALVGAVFLYEIG